MLIHLLVYLLYHLITRHAGYCDKMGDIHFIVADIVTVLKKYNNYKQRRGDLRMLNRYITHYIYIIYIYICIYIYVK